jgi:hypothetical protein
VTASTVLAVRGSLRESEAGAGAGAVATDEAVLVVSLDLTLVFLGVLSLVPSQ